MAQCPTTKQSRYYCYMWKYVCISNFPQTILPEYPNVVGVGTRTRPQRVQVTWPSSAVIISDISLMLIHELPADIIITLLCICDLKDVIKIEEV